MIKNIEKSTSPKGANDSCSKKLANKNVGKSNNTHVTSSEKDGDDSSSREAGSKDHKSGSSKKTSSTTKSSKSSTNSGSSQMDKTLSEIRTQLETLSKGMLHLTPIVT